MKVTLTKRINKLATTTIIDFGSWAPTPEDVVRYAGAIESAGCEQGGLDESPPRQRDSERITADVQRHGDRVAASIAALREETSVDT